MPLLRIEPLAGYTPTIGRLVGMLTYSRQTLVAAVDGLTTAQLDHLHDPQANSIGALLAHAAAVEQWYQRFTFEPGSPNELENGVLMPALELGDLGRAVIKGRDLASYLDDLQTTRARTLAELARRDDAWLEAPLPTSVAMNAHWAWFHVAEDEINHRGQIRWLRGRLPPGSAP